MLHEKLIDKYFFITKPLLDRIEKMFVNYYEQLSPQKFNGDYYRTYVYIVTMLDVLTMEGFEVTISKDNEKIVFKKGE